MVAEESKKKNKVTHMYSMPVRLIYADLMLRPEKLLISPADGNLIIYVGRTEKWNQQNHTEVWRSLDGGMSWHQVWAMLAKITDVIFDSTEKQIVWFIAEQSQGLESVLYTKRAEGCVHGGPGGIWYSNTKGRRWIHFGYPPHMQEIISIAIVQTISGEHILRVLARRGDNINISMEANKLR